MKDAYEQMSKLDLNLALAAHTQGGQGGTLQTNTEAAEKYEKLKERVSRTCSVSGQFQSVSLKKTNPSQMPLVSRYQAKALSKDNLDPENKKIQHNEDISTQERAVVIKKF